MKPRLIPALLLVMLAGCGSGTTTSSIPAGGETSSATTSASTTTRAPAAAPAGCKAVKEPKAKPNGNLKKPSTKLDPAKTWTAMVKTNCCTFAFQLDVRKAPHAAASIDYLAGKKFYDHTVFHRIAPGFVIQGGDPTGSGTGGPGYSTVDKPPKDTRYTKGVVAMAKSPTEPAGTAGSQFFVVTAADAGLPADYALLGKVVDGLDVVEKIGRLGNARQQPTERVVIETVTVTTS